ncbi:MAG: PDZ domain-containing protein, partial [Gemmatimonadaceae bacterium]
PPAPAPMPPLMFGLTDPIALAGAQLIAVRDELGGYFGVERGLLLLHVGRGTPAARSGLVSGDVILAVNGQEVRSPQGLQSAIKDAGEREVDLLIIRRRERQELTLRW